MTFFFHSLHVVCILNCIINDVCSPFCSYRVPYPFIRSHIHGTLFCLYHTVHVVVCTVNKHTVYKMKHSLSRFCMLINSTLRKSAHFSSFHYKHT